MVEGASYHYVVVAIDASFNRSGPSNEATGTAQLRTVTLAFNVTVPATTDATGRSVYIAGFLDRLDGNLPQWNPAGEAAVTARFDGASGAVVSRLGLTVRRPGLAGGAPAPTGPFRSA